MVTFFIYVCFKEIATLMVKQTVGKCKLSRSLWVFIDATEIFIETQALSELQMTFSSYKNKNTYVTGFAKTRHNVTRT